MSSGLIILRQIMLTSSSGIGREDVGRFLRYLAEIKFVSWPGGRGRALPEVRLSEAQMQAIGAIGGRGGVSTS